MNELRLSDLAANAEWSFYNSELLGGYRNLLHCCDGYILLEYLEREHANLPANIYLANG